MFQNGRMFNSGYSDKEHNRALLRDVGNLILFSSAIFGIVVYPWLFWFYVVCGVICVSCFIYVKFFKKKQPPKEEEKE